MGYHSDPYERTYSNIPRGYERTYSNVPGYERTYSDNGHFPSQHGKYPPMKPHDPKYPSPHNAPKPSAWKKEKTPKPTAWKSPKPKKTPKPTKAEKTPKPTVWKTQKPTKAQKTPKPTWKKTPKPTKEEKTPKPTVWKAEKTPKPTWHKMEKTPKPTAWKSSGHGKEPKHYSMNNEEEEKEDGELQNFGICMLDLYQQCTRPFAIGPNAGCYCMSGCCEGNRCVAKKRDWFGVDYCPSECVGAPGGARGTC